MTAYYNEIDKGAAAWTRQLIKMNLIMDGDVDERSIADVEPSDLKGYTRYHFFSGIAGWDYALQLAGWDPDRPVCTASLPCQPFSCAGKQQGKNDERHLLPSFIELVKQCNFKTIFGEQVPAAIKHGWIDDLYFEMERENYAVGSIVLTAAGAGAPHIRQRLYWVADRMGDTEHQQHERRVSGHREESSQNGERSASEFTGSMQTNGMVYPNGTRSQQRGELTETTGYRDTVKPTSSNEWDNPEWIYCRDNKYRPVKPGIKPLANGLSKGMVYSSDPGAPINADTTQEARLMRLKGYGNAIVPQCAAEFIKAFMAVG